MTGSNRILAIIGARSGSKGIPHKNIRPLGGKPLMSWIIGAARESKYINRIIVSTDSKEYAEVANRSGAEAPFLRPAEISGDTSPDFEYIIHAVNWLEANERYIPNIVVRLIPTVPFQRTEDIDASIEVLLKNPQLDSVMGVAEARQHPGKALRITDADSLAPFHDHYTLNTYPNARQKHEKAYFRGNIIVTRTSVLKERKLLYGERSGYHIIPYLYALDIDSELDFAIAEALLEKGVIAHA